jgi:hypothetical protein
MAQLVEQQITITLSRLIRSRDSVDQVITPEQMESLIETLPSVVEQMLDDATVVVEASSED